MVKFGGSGKSKQRCVDRKCPNMKEVEQVRGFSSDYVPDNPVRFILVDTARSNQSKIRAKFWARIHGLVCPSLTH